MRVVAFKQKAKYGQMKSERQMYNHIQLKDVATYLYKYLIINYVILNCLVLFITIIPSENITWSKDGHRAHV